MTMEQDMNRVKKEVRFGKVVKFLYSQMKPFTFESLAEFTGFDHVELKQALYWAKDRGYVDFSTAMIEPVSEAAMEIWAGDIRITPAGVSYVVEVGEE